MKDAPGCRLPCRLAGNPHDSGSASARQLQILRDLKLISKLNANIGLNTRMVRAQEKTGLITITSGSMCDPVPHEDSYELQTLFAGSQVFDFIRAQYDFLGDDLTESGVVNVCGLHVRHLVLRFRYS